MSPRERARAWIGVTSVVMTSLACEPPSLPGGGTPWGDGICSYGPGADDIRSDSGANVCSPTPTAANRAFCDFSNFNEQSGVTVLDPDTRFVPIVDLNGVCSHGQELVDKPLLDIDAQKAKLRAAGQLFAGCPRWGRCPNPALCNWWLVEPRRCFQLGFVNGYVVSALSGTAAGFPAGGQDHDGDENVGVCPIPFSNGAFTMGAQGFVGGALAQREIDLRSFGQLQVTSDFSGIHTEVSWCRWYGGPVVIEPDNKHPEAAPFDTFLPRLGERVSLVGDWVVDAEHTELHETRIMASVKSDRRMTATGGIADCNDPRGPDCLRPNTWHLLTSGFFAEDTAQAERLDIVVPVPGPTGPDAPRLTLLIPTVPSLAFGGCGPTGADSPSNSARLLPPTCDPRKKACTISVEHIALAPVSQRDCDARHVCPCANIKNHDTDTFNKCSAEEVPIAHFTDFDQCNPPRFKTEPPRDEVPDKPTRLALARDVRVDWIDPLDLWNCECECDDVSAAGSVIRARVQGCADPEFSDEQDARRACAEACGGLMCGTAPHCRIGACRVQATGTPPNQLVARQVCSPDIPVPTQRVARAGDYRVELLPGSAATFGFKVGTAFLPRGQTSLAGALWLNIAGDGAIEVAEVQVAGLDFVASDLLGVPAYSVKTPTAFILNRFRATRTSGNKIAVQPFQVRVGARASINDIPGATTFLNESSLAGVLDLTTNSFSLDGEGFDPQGLALQFHFEGRIVNHPPVAVPGQDQRVECQSPTGTLVTLDAGASFDPDPGDVLTHFQWFQGDAGVSNSASATVQLPLGESRFRLHVYDHDLGSHSAEHRVQVVDTTPPQMTSSSAQPTCLGEDDDGHEVAGAHFVAYRLGANLLATARDICDASPRVEVIGVSCTEERGRPCEATEADDDRSERGRDGGRTREDGEDAPLFVFGPAGACVSIGDDRHYALILQAVDSQGNRSAPVSVRLRIGEEEDGHHRCNGGPSPRVTLSDARCHF